MWSMRKFKILTTCNIDIMIEIQTVNYEESHSGESVRHETFWRQVVCELMAELGQRSMVKVWFRII